MAGRTIGMELSTKTENLDHIQPATITFKYLFIY